MIDQWRFSCCLDHASLCLSFCPVKMWEGRWRVIPHDVLPDWLKDNDFLLHGHRPPMPSFRACFKSIFRIHTETGNIWTHLLGEKTNKNTTHTLHMHRTLYVSVRRSQCSSFGGLLHNVPQCNYVLTSAPMPCCNPALITSN